MYLKNEILERNLQYTLSSGHNCTHNPVFIYLFFFHKPSHAQPQTILLSKLKANAMISSTKNKNLTLTL